VTPQWYATFENGTSPRRFSAAFVQRIADALRLDERERAQLARLALPEIRVALEQYERSEKDGLLFALAKLRSLVRSTATSSTFEEAVQSAVNAVRDVLSPSSVAVAILMPNGDAPRVIGTGPRAERNIEHTVIADTCLVANYSNRFGYTTFSENRARYPETIAGAFEFGQRTSEGHSFTVKVVGGTPLAKAAVSATERFFAAGLEHAVTLPDATLNAAEYWEWNSQIEARSVLTHGLFANGRYRGNLCALWTGPREMEEIEIEALRTASAIVELAAARQLTP
jgi:hypothetical protein